MTMNWASQKMLVAVTSITMSVGAMTFGAMSLVGCNKTEAECSETVPCGFGETCQEGVCVSQTCATSAQCEMETHCSKGSCVDGCAEDSDCFPGDICDLESGTCQAGACTDSHIDCDFKEFCNGVTGECAEASGIYCKSCELNSECGGNGNVCMHWGLQRDFCGVSCEVESDCPSGFSCMDWNDTETGRIVRQCATYCWLYIDDRPIPPGSPNADSVMSDQCPVPEPTYIPSVGEKR